MEENNTDPKEQSEKQNDNLDEMPRVQISLLDRFSELKILKAFLDEKSIKVASDIAQLSKYIEEQNKKLQEKKEKTEGV